MAAKDENAPDYEAEHVHTVYDQIASHFSSTRYKVCVSTYYLGPPCQPSNIFNVAMADSGAFLTGAACRCYWP